VIQGRLKLFIDSTPAGVCALLAHAERPHRSRGSGTGRVCAAIPQDPYLSRRISLLHLAAQLAVNLVLMRLRKKSPPTVSIEATADLDDEASSPSIDIGAPDLLLEGSVDRVSLERCIGQLPAGYRAYLSCTISRGTNNEIGRDSWTLGR